ncbi:hypothetical protein HH219_18770 [Pseudoalteromonas sp. NEC-BIFX-2020_015]|uniref:pilus assembly PilX family protein n=1 Tax=Pseudoalteromonas sp. NEC-BIFX-2020_015 TaxID=2729544 RepID=UPI0014616CAA|nr:pilus assembly PilX N-terminal domain-containing protein [Pseudoalteromonas sp. NEC-BIFX-2020_015]NMR27554.1 hypothetical protein [Pseudoalteromonas sp. NEC-BIFX-2020_015]
MNNKQQGFTLITVLILTSMASIVVLNSLRENIVQERMSGNFQKKMNSRLLAEKGVFEEARLMQQALDNNGALDIDGLIAAAGNASGRGLIGIDATYDASISKNLAGELEIASLGQRYSGDAQSNLVARFGFKPGNNLKPYSDAIIGCRGVSLGGSGKITSYDSTDASYNGNDADVRTTVHNANVTLNGTGTIKGSVASTGSIIVSSSQSVEGNLWANKDIKFPSGTSAWSTKINGNILANGSIQLKDMMVNGYVRSEQNLTLNNGVHVNQSAVDVEDILYGGSLLSSSSYTNNSVIKALSSNAYVEGLSVPNVAGLDPDDPTSLPTYAKDKCDPLDAATMSDLNALGPFPDLLLTNNTKKIQIKEDKAVFTSASNVTEYLPKSTNVLGRIQENMYFFNDLTINGGSLDALLTGTDNKKIGIYVAGDFTITASGESHFKIHKGISLSLYVMGKIHIRTSPIVEETIVKLTPSDAYAFNIFSGYKSGDGSLSCENKDGISDKFGVYIASNTDMNATIYAPLTDVRVDAGSRYSGSIRGGSVSNCGNGETRYDVALKNLTSGGGSNSGGKIAFLGWSYKVPENTAEEPAEPTI